MAKKISPTKKMPAKKVAAKKSAKKVSKSNPIAKTKAVKKPAKKTKKKGEDLMCFLTTACVGYYQLADDCMELNKLRKFRDNFLLSTAKGKKLVHEYYRVSPQIVSAINASENSASKYAYVYEEIKKACRKIDAGRLSAAETVYTNMVNHLRKSHNL